MITYYVATVVKLSSTLTLYACTRISDWKYLSTKGWTDNIGEAHLVETVELAERLPYFYKLETE